MPKFLKPLLNKANTPFWNGLKEEKFLIQQCKSCNEIYFPPRILCPACLSEDIEHIESKGEGSLYAFTEVRAKIPAVKTPFIVGLIELDENPGRFLTRINAPYESLEIGMRMKVQYVHERQFSVHTFIPL